MFNLSDSRAYTWYDVFLILSWEKFDDYLTDINFPFLSDVPCIRKIAHEVVRDLYSIQANFYEREKLSSVVEQVFIRAFRHLVNELGDAKTELFSKWGNQLHLDLGLVYSLRFALSMLCSVALANTGDLTAIGLPINVQKLLYPLLRSHREKSREIGFLLDAIAPEDAWSKIIFHSYNLTPATADETPASPVDQLSVWINFFQEKSALLSIRDLLSQEELSILNDWYRRQPEWVKAQSRPAPLYYQPLDLLGLMNRLE